MITFTPRLSEHLLVARGDMNPTLVHTLREALYALRDSERGRAILRRIKKSMTGMVPARDADYDNLRTILRTLGDRGVR